MFLIFSLKRWNRLSDTLQPDKLVERYGLILCNSSRNRPRRTQRGRAGEQHVLEDKNTRLLQPTLWNIFLGKRHYRFVGSDVFTDGKAHAGAGSKRGGCGARYDTVMAHYARRCITAWLNLPSIWDYQIDRWLGDLSSPSTLVQWGKVIAGKETRSDTVAL